MDSDSSLDENFETKVEVAARIGRTRSNSSSLQEGNSESESSSSSEEEGEEEREVPRDAPCDGTAKSPPGESNSVLSQEDEEDDARSRSSYTSTSSAGRPPGDEDNASPEALSDERHNDDGRVGEEEEEASAEGPPRGGTQDEEEEASTAPPPPAAADLSDVSDMDSRDSLEAVFAQDSKVKVGPPPSPGATGDPATPPLPEEPPSQAEEGEADDDEEYEEGEEVEPPPPASPPSPPQQQQVSAAPPPHVVETEQLDFEAEEQVKEPVVVASGGELAVEGGMGEEEDKEEGECEEHNRRPPLHLRVGARRGARGRGEDEEEEDEKSDGELKEGEDLEEGELTDEDEARPGETEPRPVCRFYNRGQCTWGSSCRFVHPGVTDKGNYTMFELPRALLPVNGPPAYSPDYRVPYEKTFQPVTPFQAPRKEEVAPVFESAWERGLRHAKEMMRKATKRKEMDIDFEEKKMNLSLGQEELDKENDYYTRPASPIVQAKEDPDHWSYEDPVDLYHAVGPGLGGGGAVPPVDMRQSHHHHHGHHPGVPPAGGGGAGGDYWRRVHYEGMDARSLRVEAEYMGRSDRKERIREGRDLRHHHHHVAGEPLAHPVPPPSRTDHHHHHRHHAAGERGEGGGRGGESRVGRGGERDVAPDGGGRSGRKKGSSSHVSGSTSRTGANAIPLPPQLLPEKPSVATAAWSREDKYSGVPPSVPQSQKARGDEWADPWMRSKSPTRRAMTASTAPAGAPPAATIRSSRRHHRSFSSGSSYSSSSSSSRSSSRSSYSSFSSRSRSPRPSAPLPLGGVGARQQRHASHRHAPPPAEQQQVQSGTNHHHQHHHQHQVPSAGGGGVVPATGPGGQMQGAQQVGRHHHHHHHHHRSTSGAMAARALSPTAVPRTPPMPSQGTAPPHPGSGGPSAKSRSRSPLSRAHRRRVSSSAMGGAGMQPAMMVGGAGSRGGGLPPPPVPAASLPPSSPRMSMSVVPPGRKVSRTAVAAVLSSPPPGGERKVGGTLVMGGYNLPLPTAAGMLTAGMRGSQGAMVREPSPQLVRKALHAATASIPMPQASPRIMGTTRAPQAAVAVAAAAAKSATESSSRHHRRRHDAHGGRRQRALASHRSRSSSHSSHSDDDLSDDDNSGTGSSSDSSDSSGSSTSSTSSTSSSSSDASGEVVKKATSPQVRPKRFMIDDRAVLANSMKVKAMDALKLSGQKQQIKLTLKAPGSNLVAGKRPMLDIPEPMVAMRNRDRPMNFPLLANKKRPAAPDSPSSSPTQVLQPPSKQQLIMGSMPKASVKKAPSRREELLKQLKAVEDAIARKRSKITFPGTS